MKTRSIAVAAFATVALSGCGDDQQEIRSWMQAERAKVLPMTTTVAAPKRFDPFRYDPGAVDPFSASRLMVKGLDAPAAGPKPDLERRREALERFPLESIRMVGHLENGRSSFVLLQAENIVYQARVGDYAGQNFGRIQRVSDSEIVLKELVQDAAGDWVERNTSLRLQEGTK